MTEAAPQAAVTTAADEENALARLRYGWGEAYRIGWDARRGWWAKRRDEEGECITASDADALWAAIVADYTSSPVRRSHSAFVADASECQPGAGGEVRANYEKRPVPREVAP